MWFCSVFVLFCGQVCICEIICETKGKKSKETNVKIPSIVLLILFFPALDHGNNEMAEGGEGSSGRGGGGGGALPDMVAQCYYRYGLLVATHSKKVILLAIISFLILWSVA